MSGETKSSESGWTVDTIHAHFQKQLDDMKEMLDERHTAQSTAMSTAFAAAERRFESVNEFRGQLADQATTFMPRSESEAKFNSQAERFADQQATIAQITSRLDLAQGNLQGGVDNRTTHRLDRGSIIAVISLVISILLASLTVITFIIARS